jgi:hypothetical protein
VSPMSEVLHVIVGATAIVCLAAVACLAGAVIAALRPDHRNGVAEVWTTWAEHHKQHH